MAGSLRQTLIFDATPERVYAALTNPRMFEEITGAPTAIDASAGGAFSCFGGMIQGRNIECVPGQRLVQAWRATTWEAGQYSIVRFDLAGNGERTELRLVHVGFPSDQAEHLDKGWQANYWEPLKSWIAKA